MMSGNKWWVSVRSKRIDEFMRETGWCFCFEGFSIKARQIILMRSVNFLFELTNDILVELITKNKALYQKKRYYMHLHKNRKTIGQRLSNCNLVLCSSKISFILNLIIQELSLSAFFSVQLKFTCRFLLKPPNTHISSFNDAAQDPSTSVLSS